MRDKNAGKRDDLKEDNQVVYQPDSLLRLGQQAFRCIHGTDSRVSQVKALGQV